MAAAEPFGPFRTQCGPIERRAQLRALEALVRVMVGPHPVIRTLRRAEGDERLLVTALAEFDALPALPRRRILTTFAYLHWGDYVIRRGQQPEEATDGDRQDDRTSREIGETRPARPAAS